MRIISRIAILAVVALVVAVSVQPASALCSSARLIGGCGGSGCKYIYTSVQGQAPSSALTGSFWGVGGGNPAPLLGDDNGSDAAQGNLNPQSDWVKNAGGLYYLAGAWSNEGVDGCVDNATTPSPKRTAILLGDVAPSKRPGDAKSAGYFAIMCQLADAGANYDFSVTAGQHVLAAIPYPSVGNVSPGVSVTVNPPSPAALAAGSYLLDPACGALLTGYRLYSQIGTSNPQNRNRLTGGWTPLGPCTNTASVVPTPPCGAAQLQYLAMTLCFDTGASQYETPYVSEDTKVSCGLTADRPANFKLIKKPRTTPQR